MDKKVLYTIWLTQIKGIGTVGQRRLIRTGLSSEQIYLAVKEGKGDVLRSAGISQKQIELLQAGCDLKSAEQIMKDCEANQIRVLSAEEGTLPDRFTKYDSLPILLYVRGQDIPLKQGTTVIGTRQCTVGDEGVAGMIATDMVYHGEYVISGLSKGVDFFVHKAVLEEPDGIPIAVLANGLDVCYPKEHRRLYKSILARGLAVSEYPPGVKPQRYNFPRRNRIIAALSEYIYIIGDGEKIGAKSTMEAAVDYGVPCERWRPGSPLRR